MVFIDGDWQGGEKTRGNGRLASGAENMKRFDGASCFLET
jgi:hypothetical protein